MILLISQGANSVDGTQYSASTQQLVQITISTQLEPLQRNRPHITSLPRDSPTSDYFGAYVGCQLILYHKLLHTPASTKFQVELNVQLMQNLI